LHCSATLGRAQNIPTGTYCASACCFRADGSEHFFGTALAMEEINNAIAILGREIEVVAYAVRPFEMRLCRCSLRTASLGEFGGFCFARMGA
jgi:hypothetical protein